MNGSSNGDQPPQMILLIGEGAAMGALARVAAELDLQVECLPASVPGRPAYPADRSGPDYLLSRADAVIFTESIIPEVWRARLRATLCSGRKEIPATTTWRDLWNSPTQYFWLRRHGLPAGSQPAGPENAQTGNARPEHSGSPNTFILPLVRTCRGEQLLLPPRVLSRAPGSHPGTHSGTHPGFLPPGLRRRATAISHCLAQAIGTPGVIAAEFMVQPEESVLISRVLSFPWLIEHAPSTAIRDALARIHLCAILDRPLPPSID